MAEGVVLTGWPRRRPTVASRCETDPPVTPRIFEDYWLENRGLRSTSD